MNWTADLRVVVVAEHAPAVAAGPAICDISQAARLLTASRPPPQLACACLTAVHSRCRSLSVARLRPPARRAHSHHRRAPLEGVRRRGVVYGGPAVGPRRRNNQRCFILVGSIATPFFSHPKVYPPLLGCKLQKLKPNVKPKF